MTCPAHGPADTDQFFFGRCRSGYQLAINRPVKDGAGGREAKRAGFQPILDDLRHLLDIFVGRDRTRFFPLAQYIGADCTMRHMGCDIYRAGQAFQRIKIFREGFPIPRQAFSQSSAWNVFDTFHKPDEPVMLVWFGWRKPHAAIAHDNRCHTMPAGRCHLIVPGCLTVIVCVHINKARRHNFARRINLFATFGFHITHERYTVAVNCHVANERGRPCSIDNRPTPNYQIMHFASPPNDQLSSGYQVQRADQICWLTQSA